MHHVLIAHQSTIPHYRLPFYNALEQRRPSTWDFEVVYDHAETEKQLFFKEQAAASERKFPIHEVDTIAFSLRGKTISYQTFWRAARQYDLVILENAVNNLTYPLCRLHSFNGAKLAYWGHERHIGAVGNISLAKKLSEQFKLQTIRHSAGFFAYTEVERVKLIQAGLPADRVFAVNNTIDILQQRKAFETRQAERETIRRQMSLNNGKVLLFIGRLTSKKRVDFLLAAFRSLYQQDTSYRLLIVGGGFESYSIAMPDGVTLLGPITELKKLAPIYVAADIFAFPGSTGLGPLQALCYDLPVVTIDSDVQMPEYAYLDHRNSVILPAGVTVQEYAQSIVDLFRDQARLMHLRSTIWPSIQHLTIENMAQRFIGGIDHILATQPDTVRP